MSDYTLTFILSSDATFSSGDGVAGSIDREVEHDVDGLPYLRGRTLKGLLREASDNVLDSLRAIGKPDIAEWEESQTALFGLSSAEERRPGIIHFGHAMLPEGLRQVVHQAVVDSSLSRQDVLDSLTAVRRQTANNAQGLPVDGSLRTMRVVLRKTKFAGRLHCRRELSGDEEALLAAAVLAWNRAGTGRNRGRGKLQADLLDSDGNSIAHQGYKAFIAEPES